MKNLFFQDQKEAWSPEKDQDLGWSHETDQDWQLQKGYSPEQLVQGLNSILLDYWQCTPFANNYPIPQLLISHNDNGTINISYIDGKVDDLDSVKGCSCWYTIDHEGMAHVKEFNEVLDLKDFRQLLGIAATIIQDVYGEFDIQKVTKLFFESNIQDKNH